MDVTGEAVPSGSSITVTFDQAIPEGSLLRLEITNMQFPSEGGDVVVSGTYESAGATHELADSAPIATIANTPLQSLVNWLDEQPWVEAWNSNQFLGMFLKPQLLVTSFSSLAPGWLLCLGIVVAAYPFAIALGLLFAMLKFFQVEDLRAVAVVYINVVRGTPLFLQIYIAFFGLPMLRHQHRPTTCWASSSWPSTPRAYLRRDLPRGHPVHPARASTRPRARSA